jgi:hypothetical protein
MPERHLLKSSSFVKHFADVSRKVENECQQLRHQVFCKTKFGRRQERRRKQRTCRKDVVVVVFVMLLHAVDHRRHVLRLWRIWGKE